MLKTSVLLFILVVLLSASLPVCAQGTPDLPAQSPPAELYYYRPPKEKPTPQTLKADVCIYGGTSGGIIAAVQLRRLGRSVVVLEPSGHLGGMTSGGLSWTDFGNKNAIGGMAREFYRRVGAKYGVAEELHFEPHVAERVFLDMVTEHQVPVYFRQFVQSIRTRGAHLVSLTTETNLTVEADVFLDATYEGDLMARAGVTYHVGREANSVYGETLNGVQVKDKHQFRFPVDPYREEGQPDSGLLPNVMAALTEPEGTGDNRIQAYNFRLCLTQNPKNRIPFALPENYDPLQYVLLARYLAKGWNEVFQKFDPIQGEKADVNNHGAVSTDFIGANHVWADADYALRERLFQEHVTYQKGLMWFLANDPAVPAGIRNRVRKWGLCRDEFQETGGWSHQLYIREARRMASELVLTEQDCLSHRVAEDSIGLGAYGMDSHNCQRFVRDGRVWNEGDVQVRVPKPYPLSYRIIVPKRKEADNLLVPVCVSASHIAYGSVRMEPVFMILGQSAAFAADLALSHRCAVQDVPYPELRRALETAGQVLDWKP